MRDWLGVRLTAAFVLLLGVLAAPGSGLSHGAAHLREARHLAAHEIEGEAHPHGGDHDAEVGARTAVSLEHGRLLMGAPDHHRDHGHARVDDGLRARVDGLSFVRADHAAIPVARELIANAEPVAPHAALPRADPATGPPPRLRAPPAV